MTDSSTKSVGFVSLGCPKALVDSERILTQLQLDGYAISPDYEGADVVVVNTCGFIDAYQSSGKCLMNTDLPGGRRYHQTYQPRLR